MDNCELAMDTHQFAQNLYKQQDNVAKVKQELEHIQSFYSLNEIIDLYCKGSYNAELLLQHSLKILINNLEFSQTNTNITTTKIIMDNYNQHLHGFSAEDISRINAIDLSDPNSISAINSMKLDNSTNPNLSKDYTPTKPYIFKSKSDQIYFENTIELIDALDSAGGRGVMFLENEHTQNFLAILANNNIQLKAKYLGS